MSKFRWLRKQRTLPLDDGQFATFCDRFFTTYPDIPNDDYMRDVVAKMIMHLPADRMKASAKYFATGCYKAMANAAAFNCIAAVVKKQKEADAKAREEAAKAKPLDVNGTVPNP